MDEILQQAKIIYGGKNHNSGCLWWEETDWTEGTGGFRGDWQWSTPWSAVGSIRGCICQTHPTLTSKIIVQNTNYTRTKDLFVAFPGKWKLKPQ